MTRESVALVAGRIDDPHRALGLATEYLCGSPAFANRRFGDFTRILIGQINRGHYLFAHRGDRVVGFVGWARTRAAIADAWLSTGAGFEDREAGEGDGVVVNAGKADGEREVRFLRTCLMNEVAGASHLYARRIGQDGRIRAVRLRIRDLGGMAIM